jgi:hypothetical protein
VLRRPAEAGRYLWREVRLKPEIVTVAGAHSDLRLEPQGRIVAR